MQLPWAIAVFTISVLAMKVFAESAIATAFAYRKDSPYWRAFAVFVLEVANIPDSSH
jgi:hypothetical protein